MPYNDHPLVLASTSEYRRDLLARLGIPFKTANPEADESPFPDEAPAATAIRLSELKARCVAQSFPGCLIIGSDQVAHSGSEVFSKPGSHDNAVNQLRILSGREVEFVTGLCLLNTLTGRSHLRAVTTRLTYRNLDEEQIETYLRMEKPYNCAGSAKSEGLGIALIARMECDDPTALIGLPLIALCDLLRLEGINPIA